MNNIKGVIFDMDGVILDSESISDRTWIAAAIEFGINITTEILNACRGSNRHDIMEKLKSFYGNNFDSQAFLNRTNDFFEEIEVNEGIPLLPFAKQILEYLKPRYKMALASSTRGFKVERQLRNAGVIDFFETRTTGDMVLHSKPDPEIYLMACKSVGLEPCDCVAIEDSLNGIKSAYAAGLKTIMVIDKIQPTQEIKEMCWKIFDSLDGLKSVL